MTRYGKLCLVVSVKTDTEAKEMSSVCKCTPTAPVRGPWPSFGSACLSSSRDPQLPLLHSPAPLMLGKGEVMGKMGCLCQARPCAALQWPSRPFWIVRLDA